MTKDEALKLCDYLECNDASMEAQCKAAAFIRDALAQPEQEPVAWMYQCTADNSQPVLLRQKQNWAESGTGLWVETPLYTTPPQRQPLTVWEVELWAAKPINRVALCRAIEAAHGIKETT